MLERLLLDIALLVLLILCMLALSWIFNASVLCFHTLISYTRRHSTRGSMSLMNGLLLLQRFLPWIISRMLCLPRWERGRDISFVGWWRMCPWWISWLLMSNRRMLHTHRG